MKHYDEQELDAKIKAFLTDKLQRYPELETQSKTVETTIEPNLSTRLVDAFTWFKPLATH